MLMCGITALSGFIPCAGLGMMYTFRYSCPMLSWFFLITKGVRVLTRNTVDRLQRAYVFRVVHLVEVDVLGFESFDKIGRRER